MTDEKNKVDVLPLAENRTDKNVMMNGINGKLPTIKEKPPVDAKDINPKVEDDDEELWIEEWKIVAAIIDRLCLYFFLLILVIGNIVIILKMSSS